MVLGSRLGDQRIILEEVDAGLNRIEKVLRISGLQIVGTVLVMTDSGDMSEQLTRANRRVFGRK